MSGEILVIFKIRLLAEIKIYKNPYEINFSTKSYIRVYRTH